MKKMPSPRFQLKWEKNPDSEDWRQRVCIYSLVIPLNKSDVRRGECGIPENEKKDEIELVISRTRVRGGTAKSAYPVHEGIVDTPFRDYSHALWDRDNLGEHIPIVAVCENVWNIVENEKSNTSEPNER